MIRSLALVAALSLGGCHIIIDLDSDDPGFDAPVIDAGDPPLPIDGAPLDAPDLTDCNVELPCPAPAAGRATVCGRLWDAELAAPLAPAPGATGTVCPPNGTAGGPCSVTLRYFDGLAFASDPTSAMPLVPQSQVVDDCGRFRARDLPGTTFGFLAVVSDDAAAASDARATTVVVTDEDLARPAAGFHAYTTRRATDALWSGAAGLAGPTFADRGVLLAVFAHHGQPAAGVQIRRGGSVPPAADTFGFADPGVTRSTLAPGQEVTGANGSVLLINMPAPVTIDGTGGEPAGCVWSSPLAAAPAGAVSVHQVAAATPGGGACP